jgi:hypothetical protein
MWCGLQMNESCKFIEVFVCHGPHKLLVKYGPQKNIVHACATPAKAQFFTQSSNDSNYIIKDNLLVPCIFHVVFTGQHCWPLVSDFLSLLLQSMFIFYLYIPIDSSYFLIPTHILSLFFLLFLWVVYNNVDVSPSTFHTKVHVILWWLYEWSMGVGPLYKFTPPIRQALWSLIKVTSHCIILYSQLLPLEDVREGWQSFFSFSLQLFELLI